MTSAIQGPCSARCNKLRRCNSPVNCGRPCGRLGAVPAQHALGCLRAVNILRQCAATLRDHRPHSPRREPWCATRPPAGGLAPVFPAGPSPCMVQCMPMQHLWPCQERGPSAVANSSPQTQRRSTSTTRSPLTSATSSPWRMSWGSSSWAPTGDAPTHAALLSSLHSHALQTQAAAAPWTRCAQHPNAQWGSFQDCWWCTPQGPAVLHGVPGGEPGRLAGRGAAGKPMCSRCQAHTLRACLPVAASSCATCLAVELVNQHLGTRRQVESRRPGLFFLQTRRSQKSVARRLGA